MNRALTCLVAVAVCLALASTAPAVIINGLHTNAGVFVNDPGSTVTINQSNSNPGTASINDVYSVANAANRHDILVSSDNGVAAHVHGIDDSFTFSAELVLTDGSNTPRKEAGLRINSPVTGDGLFIINSDAGEIVAFGGGMPFQLFGNNGGGNGYTPGNTILMGFTYQGFGDGAFGTQNTLEYFIDRFDGNGVISSGAHPITNLEGGALAFTVGIYGQVAGNAAGDFVDVQFTNITYTMIPTIPEPTTIALGLVVLTGLVAARRRR